MRKIREILRLILIHRLSNRQVADSCKVSHSTVGECVRRFEKCGLPLDEAMRLDDPALEKLLYPPVPGDRPPLPMPDWPALYLDYRGDKDLTLQLLWEEYREQYPQGYGRTQFCEGFRRYVKTLKTFMRQEHRAGEKAFVDFAGRKVPIRVGPDGEMREAVVFVGVLGASNFTFAEAVWSEGLADWLACHVHMFEFFGGVPEIVVPDNLKSGVTSPCRYDPDRNQSYMDLAQHYGVAVVPARVRRPKDKAKVEIAVQIVQRWILARLRKREFFSLDELNTAIRELLSNLNDRPLKRFPGSRRELFERLDRPALKPLPADRYEFAAWHRDTVPPDYLIEAFGNRYSVPFALVGKQVDIRSTNATIEVFFAGNRVASHPRPSWEGKISRLQCHMPPNHRAWSERSPETLRDWASEHGVGIAQMVNKILARCDHPEVVLRQAEGVRALARQHGHEAVENACLLALQVNRPTFRFLRRILRNRKGKADPERSGKGLGIHHENVRGPGFFSGEGEPC